MIFQDPTQQASGQCGQRATGNWHGACGEENTKQKTDKAIRTYDIVSSEDRAGPEDSAGQSGDAQGLSAVAEADSESVAELIAEGQAFEAEAVSGVEHAPDPDMAEVHATQVPEDDVPVERRDSRRNESPRRWPPRLLIHDHIRSPDEVWPQREPFYWERGFAEAAVAESLSPSRGRSACFVLVRILGMCSRKQNSQMIARRLHATARRSPQGLARVKRLH
jgi:hypothetical protein